MFFCVCLEEANWYWLRPMALGLWAQVVLLAISWSLVLCCRFFLFRRPNDPWNLRDSPSIFLGNNHGIYCNPPAIGWWTVGWSRSVSCISAPLGGGAPVNDVTANNRSSCRLWQVGEDVVHMSCRGFRFPVSGFRFHKLPIMSARWRSLLKFRFFSSFFSDWQEMAPLEPVSLLATDWCWRFPADSNRFENGFSVFCLIYNRWRNSNRFQ